MNNAEKSIRDIIATTCQVHAIPKTADEMDVLAHRCWLNCGFDEKKIIPWLQIELDSRPLK